MNHPSKLHPGLSITHIFWVIYIEVPLVLCVIWLVFHLQSGLNRPKTVLFEPISPAMECQLDRI